MKVVIICFLSVVSQAMSGVEVLNWIKIQPRPGKWNEELLQWACNVTKGKRPRAQVVKMALPETVYTVWRTRNDKVFAGITGHDEIWREVCNMVAARCEKNMELNAEFLCTRKVVNVCISWQGL